MALGSPLPAVRSKMGVLPDPRMVDRRTRDTPGQYARQVAHDHRPRHLSSFLGGACLGCSGGGCPLPQSSWGSPAGSRFFANDAFTASTGYPPTASSNDGTASIARFSSSAEHPNFPLQYSSSLGVSPIRPFNHRFTAATEHPTLSIACCNLCTVQPSSSARFSI